MRNFPELENWNPMEEDYKSPAFNSYNDMADPILFDLTTLYVKNVPCNFSEETFFSLMSDNGRKVKRHRVFPSKKDYTHTIGLVTFTTEADAQDALNCLNKKPPYRFVIQYAKNKAKEIKNSGTPEAIKDSNANVMNNEAFQPPKKFSLGRGVGVHKETNLSNLKVVVEGERRTTFHNSCEKPNKPPAEVKPVPQLLPYPSPLCLCCKKQAHSICSVCHQFYCSKECQEKDWPKHQAACQSSLSKDCSHPKSEHNLGTDSSYMSESSDGEKSSECSVLSRKNTSNKTLLNTPATNCRDQSSFNKKVPESKGVSVSKGLLETPKEEIVVKISDLKEAALPLEGKVRVCYINSPSSFWVQLEEAKNVICEMEKSLSSAVLRKAVKCSVNNVYCVNHKLKYCRVQIMKVMPSTSLVSFIDTGETCTFPLNDIYQLPESLKKYPIQAMCCNLVDSSRDKNVKWSEEEASAFKSFSLNKVFNVFVHGCSNKVYDVSLTDDRDVPVFSVISLLHLQEPNQASANKCSEIPTIWSNLKNNMEIKFHPVELVKDKIYGIIANDESATTIATINQMVQNPKTEEISASVKEGDVALGLSSQFEEYFRCVVLKKEKSGFLVHYIDFGNQESITVLHSLSSDLLQKKSFVVCCEKPDSLSTEKFKTMFPPDGPLSASVKCTDNCKELMFESVALKCLPWYCEVPGKTTKCPQAPAKSPISLPKKVMKGDIADKEVCPGKKYKIKVVYFKTSSEVFVQFVTDEGEIIKLSRNLNQFCNLPANNMNKYVPDIDEIVACKFSDDGNWYRGQILGKCDKSFQVMFIDFGNESTVSGEDIKPLSKEFVQSKLCLSVYLLDMTNEDLEDVDLLTKLCDEAWDMEVKECGKDSVQVVLSQGQRALVDFVKKKNLLSSLTYLKLPCEEACVVQIIYADSEHLYVQMQRDMKQIESLTQLLSTIEKKPVSSKVLPCHLYCGLFSDGLWYRVCIEKELASDKFMANFIDFGNKEEIAAKDLRELPEELLAYPVLCVAVTAPNFDAATFQQQKKYSVKVIGEKKGVQEVKFCNAECNNLPLHQNAAKELTVKSKESLPKVSTLKKPSIAVGQEVEISLCWVEGGTYYSHLKSAEEQIKSLESKLLKASEFVDVSSLPEIGDLLCVKCSDDIWYRGSVVEVCSTTSCKICFIDYGNSEIVSLQDMKILPISMGSFPIFSIPMKVVNDEELGDAVLLRIKVLNLKGDIFVVRVLKPKDACKESVPVIEPQVLPSTPVEVVVSFKEKERYFVQKFSDLETLTNMASEFHNSKLQAVSGVPQVGDVLCVKFTDGLFYRGLVKAQLGKEIYNIYFIDYGNTNMANISEMFVLPSTYLTKPMLCVPVQLEKAALCNPLEIDSQYTIKYTGKMNGDCGIVSISSPESPFMFNALKESSLENSAEVSFLSFDNECYYVRKSSDLGEYEKMEDLLKGLSCDKIVHIPSVNEVLLVKGEDKKLHRGRILDSNDALGQYIVCLIDSGTNMNVSACDLFYVPKEIQTFSHYTIKVKMNFPCPQVTLGDSYNVCVIKTVSGVPIVSVIKCFLHKDLEHLYLPTHESRKVVFVHKENDTHYLQELSYYEQIAKIESELGNCATSSALSYNPVEGELLSVHSILYDSWYRGSVTEVVSSNKFKVLYIDYGNSEVVSKEDLRPFSEELMKHACQAVAVKVVQPLNCDIQLNQLCSVVALGGPSAGVQNVKIQLDNSSQKFYLRDCKYVPFFGGNQQILFHHAEEVNKVYCASYDEKTLKRVMDMFSEIEEYCLTLNTNKFDGEIEPEIGELILVRYKGIGEYKADWYRAVVVLKSHPNYDVTLVDFGTSFRTHIDNCRKMVNQFMDLDITSHKCLLIGFSVSEENKAAVIAELNEFKTNAFEGEVIIHGDNKIVNIPALTEHLIEKKLAVPV